MNGEENTVLSLIVALFSVARRTSATRRRRRPVTAAHRKVVRDARKDGTYESLLEAQGGVCGICGNPRKEGGRSLCLDHDHKTMLSRGILCYRCNAGLRNYMTLDWLRKAVLYLEAAERMNDEVC